MPVILSTIETFRGLGRSNVIEIIILLNKGPMAVFKIAQLLDIDTSLVSTRLNWLLYAGIVEFEERGKFTIYKLRKDMPAPARKSVNAVLRVTRDDK